MRKGLLTGLAALAMGSVALMAEGSVTPAAAQFINPGLAQVAPAPEVTTVQYRGRHYGGPYRGRYYGRPGYRGRPYYGPRRGYYYGRPYRGRYYNPGAAAAAGVAGIAAGAIIGGAIASQNAAPARGDAWLAYCSSKYRSFDPASGTYLGYDGRRHVCQ
ncbi:BA14K family protein [Chelatococcus sp. GCM10030263]|uniref:BA14K family protein n=1 Tax=Chelatococcus sp. GCM10030263 TaxID=3273387 RepID=UPI0036067DA2